MAYPWSAEVVLLILCSADSWIYAHADSYLVRNLVLSYGHIIPHICIYLCRLEYVAKKMGESRAVSETAEVVGISEDDKIYHLPGEGSGKEVCVCQCGSGSEEGGIRRLCESVCYFEGISR